MTDDEFAVLLVEDNPGDARLIEEMFRDANDLGQRISTGETTAESPHIEHVEQLSEGVATLDADDPDVVLLDLNLPDSRGLATLETTLEAADLTPIVVFTGLDDRDLGVRAIQRGAQDYLVKDEVTGDLLVRSVQYAIERARQERAEVRRREQLEALNRLNRIVQDVTHTVITTSTREDLERAVCERLVDPDAYRFAWIGEVDRSTDRIRPRVAAGVEEGYLDEVTITVGDDDTGQGPSGQAVDTQEIQVIQNVQTNPQFEPWHDEAEERGYRSSAAVPIVHDDLLYGVLNVYAASPNAFTEPEAETLGRLGDVIGHAVAAIERKDALVSDVVLELEFRAEDVAEELVDIAAEQDGTLHIENLVNSDDALIAYGQAEGIDQAAFEERVDGTDEFDDVRVLGPGEEAFRFELVTDVARSLVESVASHGGRVTSATIDGGEFRFIIVFPPGRDKRQLIELVEEHCAGVSTIAQRMVERSEFSVADSRAVLEESLTDKQRTALEVAYFAGYFHWPRTSKGQDIADRLDISPSTFAQHLRAAERNFFDAVFDTESTDG